MREHRDRSASRHRHFIRLIECSVLAGFAVALEEYEFKRWLDGKIDGGKG
jgi:hypothetical protein